MTYEELKSRIKIMSMEDVKLMSPHNVAILTDNFCEELVKYIIIQAKTNPRQREMMNVIIQKYDEWRKEMGDVLWGSPVFGGKRDYPEHIKSLEFEIECGNTITEKGIIPPQQKATLTIQCPPLD